MAKANFRTVLADLEEGRKPDTSFGIRTTAPRYTGDYYTINVNGGEIHGNVGHTVYHYASTPQDDAILKELQEIREELAETEPMISDAIADLQEAIREKDQPKISKIARKLTIGTAQSVIAELASAALKQFLGLPG